MAPTSSARPSTGVKSALVLAGGGIAGAVYEIGALQAINDLLVDRTVNDFDIYVGTSAGAWVSALLANGFTPAEILRSMEDAHPELRPIAPRDLFQINLSGLFSGVTRVPGALWRTGHHLVRNFQDLSISDLVWELLAILPSGLYDSRAMERYMREILERPGSVNRFDQLARTVYIVATELDSGARAVFGDQGRRAAPISLAVAASCAIPVLYRPMRIFGKEYVDGGLRGNASIDLAIEAGAKLVVCINPLVPYDATAGDGPRIGDLGVQGVTNQLIRILLHGGLHYHIKNLRVKYPDVDLILIEPTRDDAQMFAHNLMHYANRMEVARHGFETVSRGIAQDAAFFGRVMARHGIPLSPTPRSAGFAYLQEPGEGRARSGAGRAHRTLLQPLYHALSRLERSLEPD